MSTAPLYPMVLATLLAGCLGAAVEPDNPEPASVPVVPPPTTTKSSFEFGGSVVTPATRTNFVFTGHGANTAGASPRALVVEAAWTCAAPPQCSAFLYVVDPAGEIHTQINGRDSARGVIELKDGHEGEWRVYPRPAESVVLMSGTIAVTVFYEAPPEDFTAL